MVNTDWPVWIEIGYLHEDDYRKVHTMTTYDKIAMYKWLLHHNKYRYCIHQLSWIHHHGFEQLRYTHMLWYENSQNTCTYMMKTTWTDKSNRGWLCCDKRKREKTQKFDPWSTSDPWSWYCWSSVYLGNGFERDPFWHFLVLAGPRKRTRWRTNESIKLCHKAKKSKHSNREL